MISRIDRDAIAHGPAGSIWGTLSMHLLPLGCRNLAVGDFRLDPSDLEPVDVDKSHHKTVMSHESGTSCMADFWTMDDGMQDE